MAYEKQQWPVRGWGSLPFGVRHMDHIESGIQDVETSVAGKADTGHTHPAADVASGTLALARIPTGTTGSTVALGDHTHSEPPVFQGYASVAQTVPTDTVLPIELDSETFDSHNGHDTTTNNSRFTIPSGWAGRWWASGTVNSGTGDSGNRLVNIGVNGVQVPGSANFLPGSVNLIISSRPLLVEVNVGDYIELLYYHEQGVDMDTYDYLGVTAMLDCRWAGS